MITVEVKRMPRATTAPPKGSSYALVSMIVSNDGRRFTEEDWDPAADGH